MKNQTTPTRHLFDNRAVLGNQLISSGTKAETAATGEASGVPDPGLRMLSQGCFFRERPQGYGPDSDGI
ncbi:hypothetical protein F6X40_10880 [Paraburkholderia sp. UCT31]|uniref:hypothetical protein n=1 Tax=Paraburkholderia sp. UCT31 TaxID=2615209 RepID=UPI0016566F63|nr:hypothetical protein [Paraburkholderia sp. UCT31]MBC8737311.1 hypothetical protein [Paraburkholderia sp. UCT31]